MDCPRSCRTLKTLTLGCKVNQYETEYLRQGLARLGYREVADGEPAQLCIVNTCTVTATADAKSRKAIRQLARQNPRAEIIVMGCYVARAALEVAALPGVVEVVTDKRQLPDLLRRLGLVDPPTGISTFGSRHRAYVKVQDGCPMACSYCIIPTVRPVLVSRPVGEVLDEIRRLVDHGHREIVLTGIHLGHYGVDLVGGVSDGVDLAGGVSDGDCRRRLQSHPNRSPTESLPALDLARLVRRIVELEGEFRLRISSLEAAEVTPELIALLAERPDRVCPHLHLSMQSGSDRVLRRMRRRWPAGQFVECCRRIRRSLDQPALTTDVIVGFPGETQEDFAATCRVVEEVGFSKLHVFRFSPRRGTPAAEMPDQVPEAVKQRRAAELTELGERLRRRYFEGLTGRRLQVLVETPAGSCPGLLLGTSDRYTPVELAGDRELIGRLVTVTAGPVVAGRIRAAEASPIRAQAAPANQV
jgi:threonylcarbamoyladenosine tRNA methylthiotransferase MtaB